MGIDVSITLQDLQCITQDRGSNGSAPYIWPAMAWINTTTGNVIVVAPGGSSLARVVLSNGMKSGDTASIPSTIGVITRRFDDDLANYKTILIVVLWEKRDLSDNSIAAGYNVFPGALQDAIVANLGGLVAPDPGDAINAVKNSVHQQVYDAIYNTLTDAEKVELKTHVITADSNTGNANQPVSTMPNQSFQLTFNDIPGNDYIIDAQLQLKPVTCEAELNAVNQDQVVLNQLEAQLRQLQAELAKAPVAEKKAIEQDIRDFTKNEIAPAKAKLVRDTQALEACRAGSAVTA
jgi:hypothetical protein